MRIQRFTFIIAFLWGTTVLVGQSAEEWFQKGNTAYTNAAYKQAQEAYLKAIEAGEESAALYYNLGNTYYRMNQVAESIYYFEKGLQLDPDDADIKNNILFAKNMTVDAIEQLPVTQIAAWQQTWMAIFSLQQWSLLSVLFIWLFFFLMIAYLLQKAVRTKKRLFILGLSFALLSLGAFSTAYVKYHQMTQREFAIIFSERIEVKTEPNTRSEAAFVLHEGTKVEILEVFQDWQKIRIANGAEGWVFNANIRSL